MTAVDVPNLRNRIAATKAMTGYNDRQFVDVPVHVLERLLDERERMDRSLTTYGYIDRGGELWVPPLGPRPPVEEELVQTMVEADDGLAGFERCRHMLRAVMGKLGKVML